MVNDDKENNDNYIKRSIYDVERDVWIDFAAAAKQNGLKQRDFLKKLIELYKVYGIFK